MNENEASDIPSWVSGHDDTIKKGYQGEFLSTRVWYGNQQKRQKTMVMCVTRIY
jgi:hypothetical protein